MSPKSETDTDQDKGKALAKVPPAIDRAQEMVALAKRTYFRGAPEEVVDLALYLCRRYGLDPMAREVMLVPRKHKKDNGDWETTWSPLVGRDGFLAIAHQNKHFDGLDSKAIRNAEGKVTRAVCNVYRKDFNHPFTVEVAYEEYVEKKKDGTVTRMWAEKPETMLLKVAESQALRKAFRISGVYAPEELGGDEDTMRKDAKIAQEGAAKPPAPPVLASPPTGQAPEDDWGTTPTKPEEDLTRKLTEEERADFCKRVIGMGFSPLEARQLLWERAVILDTKALTMKTAEEILNYLTTRTPAVVLEEIRDHINIQKQTEKQAAASQ